ncbi:MAG: hypothetical protein COU68_04475 [Candidatus Pacebacteria bacterium CG10_big_fil_rev_8_21_14_0_10_45_6]|nr:MAG: hypothetical protein COU68_04475 [Candidatus Pacebacteria bacterium CG10_big_fil_rev_8_21_14_0_10_45_6]
MTEAKQPPEFSVDHLVLEQEVAGVTFFYIDFDHAEQNVHQDITALLTLEALLQKTSDVVVEYFGPDINKSFAVQAMGSDSTGASKRAFAETIEQLAARDGKTIYVADIARDLRYTALWMAINQSPLPLSLLLCKLLPSQNYELEHENNNKLSRRLFLKLSVSLLLLGTTISALTEVLEHMVGFMTDSPVPVPGNLQDLRRFLIAKALLRLKEMGVTSIAITYPPVHREGIFGWMRVLEKNISDPQHDRVTSMPSKETDGFLDIRKWEFVNGKWVKSLLSSRSS